MVKETKSIHKRPLKRLSHFSKEEGWILFTIFQFQGFWYPDDLTMEGVLLAQQYFRAQPWDIFLCSSPKIGTTWLKALSLAIISKIVRMAQQGVSEPCPELNRLKECRTKEVERSRVNSRWIRSMVNLYWTGGGIRGSW
ncbi:hypothetical protein PTKIN_Ptkin05aG0182300 [Pterospermum kingtungense]